MDFPPVLLTSFDFPPDFAAELLDLLEEAPLPL